MGFFDKVKNMFTEEVEDEVKVEQIKKEVTHISAESPSESLDEIQDFKGLDVEEDIQKPNKAVFFDDNDFRDLNLIPKKEDNYTEKEIYVKKVDEKPKEKKVFKPTPIISPIYGVLNKNYHKEDIVTKETSKSFQEDIEPSVESIRNKAYGTLEDELENTLFGNNSILFKQMEKDSSETKVELEEINEDLLSNLTDDIGKELDELLIKKEKYFEQDTSNEDIDDDILKFIDSTLYNNGDDENVN